MFRFVRLNCLKTAHRLIFGGTQVISSLPTFSLESSRNICFTPSVFAMKKRRKRRGYPKPYPNSDDEESVIMHELFKCDSLSFEEWQLNEATLCEKFAPKISVINYEGVMVKILYQHKKFDLFHSFMDYIKQSRGFLTIYTQTLLIPALLKEKEVPKEEILTICDSITSRAPILDATMTDAVICGLCISERWREALVHADLIKQLVSLKHSGCNAIIKAAIENNEPDIAWQYLSEIFNLKAVPSTSSLESICSWIESLLMKGDKSHRQEMIKLLTVLRENEICVSQSIAEKILMYFKKLSWGNLKYSFTTIKRHADCNHCKTVLQSNKLSDEEHKQLTACLNDKVLLSSDVFLNTTPTELRKFYNFINKKKPFDVVIDGLNVSYSTYQYPLSQNLRYVVSHFVENRKRRVLVIGRKHMEKSNQWNEDDMNHIKSISSHFFSDNISNDDPFLLLSALMSGPNCKIVTNDFLRDHIFKVENDEMAKLFKRWQQYSQVYVSIAKEKVLPESVIKHRQVVQWNDELTEIHIPYNEEQTWKIDRNFHEDWLCISLKG